jgi:hypothetical protein
VKPVIADFHGDGQPDLAVVVDFNKKLAAWLKRGTVILNLDSPSLAPMRLDNEQHFCFGLLVLDGMQPERKTLSSTDASPAGIWFRHRANQAAAVDLDMESGSDLAPLQRRHAVPDADRSHELTAPLS